jgi:hypothetical protein
LQKPLTVRGEGVVTEEAPFQEGNLGGPLETQGKTIVEDAGHYATEENLYVSAARRADGEPATDEDANAYLISNR